MPMIYTVPHYTISKFQLISQYFVRCQMGKLRTLLPCSTCCSSLLGATQKSYFLSACLSRLLLNYTQLGLYIYLSTLLSSYIYLSTLLSSYIYLLTLLSSYIYLSTQLSILLNRVRTLLMML